MYTFQLTINCFQYTRDDNNRVKFCLCTSAFQGYRAHHTNNESFDHTEPQQNRTGLHTHRDSRAPLSVFVASRAEQIAEQSAELSTAVVPCRTWQGPFSQHDSAVQNGAILEPGSIKLQVNNKKIKSLISTFNAK